MNNELTVTEPKTESIISVISRAASDPHCDIAKMKELLDMQERIMAKQAESEFAISMRAAQEEMQPILRDGDNQGKKFAKLESIDAKIRPIYTRHGFSLTFDADGSEGDTIKMRCTVLHIAGHKRDYYLSGALDGAGAKGGSNKTPIQAAGSTVSYLRRYLTIMIFNLALTNEDNDGAGSEFIGERQQNQILDMFASMNFSAERVRKFFDVMGVENETVLPVRDFPKAMQLLQAAARKAGNQ